MTGADVKRQVMEAMQAAGGQDCSNAAAALDGCVVLTAEEAKFVREHRADGSVRERWLALLTPTEAGSHVTITSSPIDVEVVTGDEIVRYDGPTEAGTGVPS